jgi:hypothetical protein
LGAEGFGIGSRRRAAQDLGAVGFGDETVELQNLTSKNGVGGDRKLAAAT